MTCFTGTNVQMLTRRKALQARRERAERRALREGKGNSRASTRDANTDKENKVRIHYISMYIYLRQHRQGELGSHAHAHAHALLHYAPHALVMHTV